MSLKNSGDNLSLLYCYPNGGCLYQAGAREIPSILKSTEIDLLILAAKEYQPNYIKGVGFSQIDKIYLPLRDTILLSPKQYKRTINDAKQAALHAANYIKQGKNVLSTCWAGWNRSGLISGFTLANLTGADGPQIVKHIRKHRSVSALSNPLFASAVANS